ncbi:MULTISPECIES: type III secretion system stator protein SctL [unclassified Burkholderia]|uniref:type III secretion system stator protein SctL n=1 Tax=unclassified Burkholderia TaxID=2613784 RepID=UPI00214F6BFB|nr:MULTISPECIES: type III secretion system stator protein SctL [unclassified Burkholderia]MCR4468322.1 type III secretion system stator protein SctL [Burkholderia sp. SCN-KJ]
MVIWLSNPRQAGHEEAGAHARLGVDGDILPRETFGALVDVARVHEQAEREADAALAAAREEALRIIAAGREEADAVLDDARREYAAAAARGYDEGMAQGLADWLASVARAGGEARAADDQMRGRMAEIVAVAVEQIVRSEGADALFERALATVDRIVEGSTYLRVAVHPDDLGDAQAAFDGLADRWRELGRPLPMTVVADKRLERGSCVCESDLGLIDASVSTQLRTMRAAIARALKLSVQNGDRSDAAFAMQAADDAVQADPAAEEGVS